MAMRSDDLKSESSSAGSNKENNASCANSRKRRDSVRTGRVRRSQGNSGILACTHCRAKKVKCILEEEGCKRCQRFGINCPGPSEDSRRCPSSKSHIKELYERIATLEAALVEATSKNFNYISPASSSLAHRDRRGSITKLNYGTSSPSSVPNGNSDNIISRLCGRQWKLNSDEDGRYKFFGPTSSLHLTESVSSSISGSAPQRMSAEDASLDGLFNLETQTHLLDMYWTFQHTVLQTFDRDEFLEGMRTGQTQYFSKALLCAVYACAARISTRPELRAMVTQSQDDIEDDQQPFLVGMTAKLIELELRKPQITTIHALLLLSVIYCSSSKDTKGWLITGNACRLAIDFGLHRSGRQLDAAKLTFRDVKVRRVTYLGCLVFDRYWALYLGRPYCLQVDDDELHNQFSTPNDESWEMRLAISWARLLVSLGRISDALNNERCDTEVLEDLDAQLEDWYQMLDQDLRYYPRAHASVLLLHMQYHSSKIILHRATAEFGSTVPRQYEQSDRSRQICIDNAKSIATALHHYRQTYDDCTTLSGVGLHIIANASTILIADISERKSINVTRQAMALNTCVLSLSEMEKTYTVARRVRRIIRLVMGRCHLDFDNIDMPATPQDKVEHVLVDPAITNMEMQMQQQLTQYVGVESGSIPNAPWCNSSFSDDLLSGASQFGIMYSLNYGYVLK